MRPFRFAIHLAEFGWEPTVLTIASPGQRLTNKEARLLRDVRVLTIDPPVDLTARSESQLRPEAGIRRRKPSLLAQLTRYVDRQIPVDSWLPLFAARFPGLVRKVSRLDPDVIWATGDPWSGLVLGRWLSKRLNRPYVADFRDPWTLSSLRSEGLWPVTQSINRRVEARILRSADVVLFQAKRVEEAYARHYAHLDPRTTTIRNSFDPDVFEDPISVDVPAASRRGDQLRIGFFGRFRALSPASLMIEVLASMHRRYGTKAERVVVHSFGELSPTDSEHAHARGVRAQFVADEPVPLEHALRVLRTFDLLLISTEIRRKWIIPAKLFEYLPSGRPILSLSRNPEVAELLERTGTGVQLEDPDEIAALLAGCVDALERGDRLPIPFEPVPEEIMRYEARSTTAELAQIFDSLSSSPEKE